MNQQDRNRLARLATRVATHIDKQAQTATKSEIEKAYKELITIHHPDAGGTVEMSQVLNRAYSDAMKGR